MFLTPKHFRRFTSDQKYYFPPLAVIFIPFCQGIVPNITPRISSRFHLSSSELPPRNSRIKRGGVKPGGRGWGIRVLEFSDLTAAILIPSVFEDFFPPVILCSVDQPAAIILSPPPSQTTQNRIYFSLGDTMVFGPRILTHRKVVRVG